MLEYRNVSVSCGHTPILKDISVSFPEGRITALIGPNGCGKTTLLQCLNKASKVTSGTILLNGQDFLHLPDRERAKQLSFLPQVRTIIPSVPVKTLAEHGRFPYLGFTRRKTAEDIRIIERAMEFAQVSSYAEQSADTLSGGVRQRAFLAMLLAQDCSCMILDEPTTFMDPHAQRLFLDLIRKLRDQGKTIILVLHDLTQAVSLADYLVIMNERKIAASDTPEKCLQLHIIEDVFNVSRKTFSDDSGTYELFI